MSTMLKRFYTLCLIIILSCCITCDRLYWIKGKVIYKKGIGESKIVELLSESELADNHFITDADISIYFSLDEYGNPKDSINWSRTVKSDSIGAFEINALQAPVKKKRIGLRIKKDGFKSIYTTYIDNIEKKIQYFNVYLVPDSI